MRSILFIFGFLMCLNIEAFAKSVGEVDFDDVSAEIKAEDEQKPQRPTFSFTLPSFSSLSLPTLNLPQLPSLQALNIPNPFPVELIRATKTEYVEVTRRQTVHPVCYTAYAVKAPCLPYRQQEDDKEQGPEHLELNTANHVHESYDLVEEENVRAEQSIKPTAAFRMVATTQLYNPVEAETVLEDSRSGKYLEFKNRKESTKEKEPEDEVRLEGSESLSTPAPTTIRLPFVQRQTTEYVTKTVLITKLEKFTDHRVTATMVAHNCLPVDPAMPRCRGYINPIYESPIHQIHNTEIEPSRNEAEKGKEGSIIIASIVHTKPGVSIHDHNQEILAAVEAVNQASQSIQNRRPLSRPHVIPPLFSGTLGIHLGDSVQNVEEEKIEIEPVIEEADPEEGKEQTTVKEE